MARSRDEKEFEQLYIERMNLLNEAVRDRKEFNTPFGNPIIRGLIGAAVTGIVGFIAGVVSGDGNHEKVWNFFAEKGFSDAAIAGIMGNLEVESGMDPSTKQLNGGPGRGLLQWTVDERWVGVLDYAEENGLDEWSLEAQLGYLWEVEMSPSSYEYGVMERLYGGMDKFKSTSDYKWAVEAFEGAFERAGVPHLDRRYNHAKDFMDKYGGKGGGLGSGKAKQIVDICKYWMDRPNELKRGAGRSDRDVRSGRFDSAAFIHRVFTEANIEIGERSQISEKELLRYGTQIGLDELRTGDIVFFDTHRTYSQAAVYIGSGRCIGAFPKEGVALVKLDEFPWKQKLSATHRRLME